MPPKTEVSYESDSSDNEKSEEDEDSESEEREIREAVKKQNKKKKKSGGFQSMGLTNEVFRGIFKKGYKIPTPIQRKTIPLILDGKDVVAMARTGSGKTASFLIPMFEKLTKMKTKSGARALILSPTKELALQTAKFTRDLGRFTGLKNACILGGESMEKQFGLIHENPDVIIATPGRFVHLCVEMGMKLNSIEYVVFDEADRLFEMGFGEQLKEILARLPDFRQTLLFSATLPKLLVDFAKAGLSDPCLVRLDVDTKVPDTLLNLFFRCRGEGKSSALIQLLRNVIHKDDQTIVFCDTRHRVEYLHVLLEKAGIESTYIYSHLDPTARKINTAKFQSKKVKVLIVTDLAARGIDIPLLDNVINFNFPSQAKLFVHRVGRVARAGRKGTAYSLVANDEMAYFIDLQLFLSNSVKFIREKSDETKGGSNYNNKLGNVPQSVYDENADQLANWHDLHADLQSLKEVADRGYKKYLESRGSASMESVKRARGLGKTLINDHPVMTVTLDGKKNEAAEKRSSILEEMKKFRPQNTVFEIGNTAKSAKIRQVMCDKRNKDKDSIEKYQLRNNQILMDKEEENNEEGEGEILKLESSTQNDLESVFGTIMEPKAYKQVKLFNKKKRNKKPQIKRKDEENYIGYSAKDQHTESGFSLNGTFEIEARKAVLDLTGDDDDSSRAKRNANRWDAKKKKYIKVGDSEKKKIKTESGVWIPASYKSDRYAKWKERSQVKHHFNNDDDHDNAGETSFKGRKRKMALDKHPAMKKAKTALPKHKKGPKRELKRPEEVLKARKQQNRMKYKNSRKSKRGKK